MARKKISLKSTVGIKAAGNQLKGGFSISLEIPRSASATLEKADELLTGASLDVSLVCDPNDAKDGDGQALMESAEGNRDEIEFIASCSGFTVRRDAIRFSVTVGRDDVDIKELSKFSFRTGKATLSRVGDSNGSDDD